MGQSTAKVGKISQGKRGQKGGCAGRDRHRDECRIHGGDVGGQAGKTIVRVHVNHEQNDQGRYPGNAAKTGGNGFGKPGDEAKFVQEAGHADQAAHPHEAAGHDHAAADAHSAEAIDPHVWLDPLNMPLYTANISKALIKQQTQQAQRLALQWQLYQLKLAKLHGESVRKFAAIPVAKRKVLTSHSAFAYMGRRYQIQFYAPVNGGHEAEASAKTLVDLIRQVRSENIQAVFVENVNDARLLEQLGRETGLHIKGKLYSDALSSDAPDYFSFYRHNVDLLVQTLQH